MDYFFYFVEFQHNDMNHCNTFIIKNAMNCNSLSDSCDKYVKHYA
jgi:hypothetical protein